jgi:hypothetical protein
LRKRENFRRGVRRVRSRNGGAVREQGCRPFARRRRHRAPPRQDRGHHQQRATLCRAHRRVRFAGRPTSGRSSPRTATRLSLRHLYRRRHPTRFDSRRISSAAVGASSDRRRCTRSCKRWVWSTTTPSAANGGRSARDRASPSLTLPQ